MLSPLASDLGVQYLLVAAEQAPSVLNTQPWRLRTVGDDVAELLCDPSRRLRVSDPRGRSMHVSCGAALFNLRLAVRIGGYRPTVSLLPDTDDPTLLASIRMTESTPANATERSLYSAIRVRRTNREPFDDRLVPPSVLAGLRIAASREGANLVPLDDEAAGELLEQVAVASDELAGDRGYLAELAAWTAGRALFDGVPRHVHGPRPDRDPAPVRDFGIGHRGQSRRVDRFESRPQLAVLTTRGDRPVDWLHAGQALQRVLLMATCRGISASFLNQPLDLRDMRRRTDPRHARGHAQMIIRFGYGPVVPRAPRRPAGELLLQDSRKEERLMPLLRV
ncbi:nitroreductase family protein [Microtetraspora sp. NBRC 16547]|uniref:Acg family FMN-binding oxidoreductase n=1 Tax=Microtetraspora sp. NBRC 16547 TaxID=3030993 RepID=UPI0024A1DE9F|nr:nitroreductase family protein [Microtetraspora sp. NBRC 16547]GLW98582.1 nitroreductase [Microtetraspora sp. NBRC 16547]